MRKKIGIITFHFPHNVGAVLQCYALQTKLQQMGFDVVVVDYRPEYHTNMYKPLRNPIMESYRYIHTYKIKGQLNKIYRFGRHCFSILRSNFGYFSIKERQKIFDRFVEDYLVLSGQYLTIKELSENPPAVDILISGSDQLWNTDVTNGQIDRVYFLDFGSEIIRRITYAVSVDIKNNEWNVAIQLMKKLNAVSVREKDSMDSILARDSSIPISIQPDPTLLIEKASYDSIADKANLGEYILFYGLRTNDTKRLLELLKKTKKVYNLDVIDISPIEWHVKPNVRKPVISPTEFICLVRGAKCVITNSFHGTVFSCIYNVPFWVAIPSLKSSRITNLLSQLGLEDRIVKEVYTNDLNAKETIDFKKVNDLLSKLREEGTQYLLINCGDAEFLS